MWGKPHFMHLCLWLCINFFTHNSSLLSLTCHRVTAGNLSNPWAWTLNTAVLSPAASSRCLRASGELNRRDLWTEFPYSWWETKGPWQKGILLPLGRERVCLSHSLRRSLQAMQMRVQLLFKEETQKSPCSQTHGRWVEGPMNCFTRCRISEGTNLMKSGQHPGWAKLVWALSTACTHLLSPLPGCTLTYLYVGITWSIVVIWDIRLL